MSNKGNVSLSIATLKPTDEGEGNVDSPLNALEVQDSNCATSQLLLITKDEWLMN